MAIADELIAILGYRIEGEDAARRWSSSLDDMAGKLSRFAKMAGMVAVAAAGAAATGLTLLGKGVIETSAKFQQYETVLSVIEGSSERARQSMDWIKQFAVSTPYDVDQITASFVKLKSYGIDPIAKDTMRILGDTASAMNKTLDQAVEAFSDASTFQFERLREFGIVASQKGDEVTFKWTKNGKELTKVVKKNGEEIRTFLLETFGSKFSGAMDKQSKNWTGMISNLEDQWTNFKLAIGEAGFFDAMSKQVQGLLDRIQALQTSGSLDVWAKRLSDALTFLLDVTTMVADRVITHLGALLTWLESLDPSTLWAVGAAMAALAAWAFPTVAIVLALALAIEDLLTWMEGGDSIIGSFVDALRAMTTEDWAAVGRQIGEAIVSAISAAIVGGTDKSGIDWGAIARGWYQLLLAEVRMFVGIGTGIAQAILDGLRAAGSVIKNWIMEQVPGAEAVRSWFTGEVSPEEAERQRRRAQSEAGQHPPGWIPPARGFEPEGAAAPNQFDSMLRNFETYADKIRQAPETTLNDNRQDNRQFPISAPVSVEVNVSQPTSAPAAVGQAVGKAAAGAVAAQRSQVQQEPAF